MMLIAKHSLFRVFVWSKPKTVNYVLQNISVHDILESTSSVNIYWRGYSISRFTVEDIIYQDIL